MRVAELLSDFTSLQPGLCDQNAALALVSARADGPKTETLSEKDADLQRVKDLIELHGKVKSRQAAGIDQELNQARAAVANTLNHS
ncbi:hypothetical protein AMS68_001909 [Peltaster fructicola]|uniref:Uncharacterized protein n=1 Tax=Peltaster fructicola TaxID=286661 RepID=A0A6H0XNQ6_9PEZI|nr:hypothetical protein AMS68_001909 [Peltaster fructicola]